MLDRDTGFVQRSRESHGGHRLAPPGLEAAPRVEEFAAMRVNALVVDLALLGPTPGTSSSAERRGARHGHRGLHRPLDRGPARARAAAGRRRLDHQALSPRRGAGPRGGGRAPPQAATGARPTRARCRPASWRSAPTSSRPSPQGRSADLTRREFEVLQLLADAEGKVLQREEIYQLVWGYTMAHGDRSVDVFIRKVRQKLERASPGLALHPHPLRRGLPLRPRAPRRRAARRAARARRRRARPTWARSDTITPLA